VDSSNSVVKVEGTVTSLMDSQWSWLPMDYTVDPDGSIRVAITNSRQIIRFKF
jgi:hypothetical protein